MALVPVAVRRIDGAWLADLTSAPTDPGDEILLTGADMIQASDLYNIEKLLGRRVTTVKAMGRYFTRQQFLNNYLPGL